MVEKNNRSERISTDKLFDTAKAEKIIEGKTDAEDHEIRAFFLLATIKNLITQMRTH